MVGIYDWIIFGRIMSQGSKPLYDYMFKVILLGSSGVGKSNILLKFTRNQFNESHQTTLGVEYAAKNLEINGKIIRLQIWDTAGQEQYRAIMKTYFKGASAVFLTYDITQEKSYADLEYWHKQIKEYSKSEIVMMLVGNKSDLEEQRVITKQKGLEYAEKNKIAFYEVSAKEGSNIELIFTKIAEELEKIMAEAERAKKESIMVEDKPDEGKGKAARQGVQDNEEKFKLEASKDKVQQKQSKKCCS